MEMANGFQDRAVGLESGIVGRMCVPMTLVMSSNEADGLLCVLKLMERNYHDGSGVCTAFKRFTITDYIDAGEKKFYVTASVRDWQGVRHLIWDIESKTTIRDYGNLKDAISAQISNRDELYFSKGINGVHTQGIPMDIRMKHTYVVVCFSGSTLLYSQVLPLFAEGHYVNGVEDGNDLIYGMVKVADIAHFICTNQKLCLEQLNMLEVNPELEDAVNGVRADLQIEKMLPIICKITGYIE